MSTKQPAELAECRCGSTRLHVNQDDPFTATIIECAECGCMVGARTGDWAKQMWNAAMAGSGEEVTA